MTECKSGETLFININYCYSNLYYLIFVNRFYCYRTSGILENHNLSEILQF